MWIVEGGSTSLQFPSEFHIKYDGVDFMQEHTYNFRKDYYDEGLVGFTCQQECDVFCIDDTIDLKGAPTSDGYELYVAFDSEVDSQLFYDGGILFQYDDSTQHFKMYGYADQLSNVLSYAFYNPEHVVDMVVTSLRCYAESSEAGEEGLVESLQQIATAIEQDKPHLVETAMVNDAAKERERIIQERVQRFYEAMRFWEVGR